VSLETLGSTANLACYKVYSFPMTETQKSIVSNLDFISFYRDVFHRFDNSTPQGWLKNFDYVKAFHEQAKELVLKELSKDDIARLAEEVHETGYLANERIVFTDPKKISLGASLNSAAEIFLKNHNSTAYENYVNRYENFSSKSNKIKMSDLGFSNSKSDLQQAEAFFKAAGKNLTTAQVAEAIEKNSVVINLYQQSYNEMVLKGQNIQDRVSKAKWESKILDNQLNAITNSFIVRKISRDLAMENKFLKLDQKALNKMIWILYTYVGQYEGANGYFKDSLVAASYDKIEPSKLKLDQTIDAVIKPILESLPLENIGNLTQGTLKRKITEGIASGKLQVHEFVKNAPTLGYKVTEQNYANLPAIVRKLMGDVDGTKYTGDALKKYIGSVINLQVAQKGGVIVPDVYPVNLDFFLNKYITVDGKDVMNKNSKYLSSLEANGFSELLSSNDPNLTALLKIARVPMVKASDLGINIEDAKGIQSPWGDKQNKPAGREAYLVFEKDPKGEITQVYIVNVDEATNLPIAYINAPSK
ncbi:MAG: hypothetical protein HUU56_15605, partial [Bdellovibrionaceae bacterium]|nr:hypothetical protein [Pseudobdellovibrionaceae bacterium]